MAGRALQQTQRMLVWQLASVCVQVRMHYYEWWSRALKPGVHFVEVIEGEAMCDDIVRKVADLCCSRHVPDPHHNLRLLP